MIAALVAAQHAALDGLPPGALPGGRRSPRPGCHRRRSTRRAGARRELAGGAGAHPRDDRRDGAARAGAAARTALATAEPGELEALADRFLGGDVAAGEAAEMVFVAAALQVAWTRMAALLDKDDLDPRGRCRPMPGLRLAADRRRDRAGRHQVRPSPSALLALRHGVALCAGALRALRQHRQDLVPPDRRHVLPARRVLRELPRLFQGLLYREGEPLEPLADDLASLGLDMMVGEEGFARVAQSLRAGRHGAAGRLMSRLPELAGRAAS